MALSSSLIWEVRPAGSGSSDSNSGAFKAGASGTDRSQSDTAFVTFNGSTITATTSGTTTTIAITGYTVVAADVGNVVQITGGTNFTTGFYEITAADTTLNTWTFDRNCTSGAGTAMTGAMGGALATLGKLAGAMVTSNKAFIKAGTGYTTSATIIFAQSAASGYVTTPLTRLIGYGTTRGDNVRAVLTLTTNTGLTAISVSNNSFAVENLSINCASLGTSTGISMAGNSFVRNCKVANFTSNGIKAAGSQACVYNCEVTGGTSAATGAINLGGNAQIYDNWIHDNACTGIYFFANIGVIVRNLVTNNSGGSSDGLTFSEDCVILFNTFYKNGRDGAQGLSSFTIQNLFLGNLFAENGRYGLNPSNTAYAADPMFDGNAYYLNTSGARNNMDSTVGILGVSPYINVADVILTADPFVAKASNDFRLNSVAGGGAACRGHGVPQSWPGNALTVAYPDMGVAQSQAVAGGAPATHGILDGGGL